MANFLNKPREKPKKGDIYVNRNGVRLYIHTVGSKYAVVSHVNELDEPNGGTFFAHVLQIQPAPPRQPLIILPTTPEGPKVRPSLAELDKEFLTESSATETNNE